MNETNYTTSLSAGEEEALGFELRFDTNNLIYAGGGVVLGTLITLCVFCICIRLQRRAQQREDDK